MKTKPKKKPVVNTKLKLEYLRQIHKNLMYHITQPREKEFGLYEAPSAVLDRVVHVLEYLTKSYKRAARLVKDAEKEGMKAGKPGTIEYAVASAMKMIKTM